jgi:tetratricopeptide (TPR) repeat protein
MLLDHRSNLLTTRGRCLAELDRHGEALLEFDAVLRSNPNNHDVWTLKSLSHLKLGETQAAQEALAKAESIAPEKVPKQAWTWHCHVARVRLAQHDLRGALEALAAAMQIAPLQWEPHFLAAGIHLRQNDIDAGLAESQRSIELHRSVQTMALRSVAYLMAKRYAEAQEDLDAILALQPGDAAALMNRGAGRLLQGNLDEAQADCDAALRLDPQQPFALTLQAEINLERGQCVDALSWAQKALDIRPRYLRGAEVAAKAADQLGQTESARFHYELFIRYAADWQEELEPDLTERLHHARKRLEALGS